VAVYTPITKQQLAVFMAGYDCGEVRSFEGIQGGVENSNFHVVTSQGRYILTIFEKRVAEDDLPFFFAFTEHLDRHGVACPRTVPDRHGELIAHIANKPAALITFLEGEQVPLAGIARAHCQELGAAVARAHGAAMDFRGYRHNTLDLAGWKALFEKTKDRADEVEKGLAALIGKELDFLTRRWPEHLPSEVVHADIFPDNVFFKDGKFAGFIDFYFSCTDYRAYDLALVINAWCFDADNKWNQSKFMGLMKGYNSERELTLQERRALTVLCRGAAVRILMTRLHDWLFHDPSHFVVPKDPKEYIAKLRHHQNDYVTY
jgi:homoserine kinase type II